MGNYEGKNSKPPISGDNVPFINQNEGLQEKDDNEEIKDQTYNLIQDNNHPNNISKRLLRIMIYLTIKKKILKKKWIIKV